MSILLAEDDPTIRLAIADFFTETGLRTWEAENARDALAMLHDPAYRVNVLVTDLHLGSGANGLVLAAEAKRHLPHLQVVYETGSPEKLVGRAIAEWERVFLKPFDMSLLAETVFALDRQVARRLQAA
jgi:DNA-binding NtrC family response regulator